MAKATIATRTTSVSIEETNYDAGKEVNLPRMIKRLQQERNCAAENFKVTNQAYVKEANKVRELREGVEAVEMENKRLIKENDRLREELEKALQYRTGHSPECGGMDEENQRCGCGYLQGTAYRHLADRITTLTTALAAAKGVLGKCVRGQTYHIEELAAKALALIAASEKE